MLILMTDLEKIDGITNGTVEASKAVVVDSNKDADGSEPLSLITSKLGYSWK